mmetsp:Transcript_68490/g.111148  ORF Transcript_68490/g.111148 Transcript_68490/m.111148 type:complete len:129 (-) Transcript_68490:585-971(-)
MAPICQHAAKVYVCMLARGRTHCVYVGAHVRGPACVCSEREHECMHMHAGAFRRCTRMRACAWVLCACMQAYVLMGVRADAGVNAWLGSRPLVRERTCLCTSARTRLACGHVRILAHMHVHVWVRACA